MLDAGLFKKVLLNTLKNGEVEIEAVEIERDKINEVLEYYNGLALKINGQKWYTLLY